MCYPGPEWINDLLRIKPAVNGRARHLKKNSVTDMSTLESNLAISMWPILLLIEIYPKKKKAYILQEDCSQVCKATLPVGDWKQLVN